MSDTMTKCGCKIIDRLGEKFRIKYCPIHSAAPALLDACLFVKEFFKRLEDDTEPNDPLLEIRRHFHAPVHKVLDAAISKAEGKTL
jgi:hypothetical protein